MNLADYNIGGDDPQSLLFVGDSGVGKSIAAADWKRENDSRKIYFASCDGRMGSVAEWHRGRSDIEFDIFTGFKDLDEKIDQLESNCPFQTIVVDPVSNISSMLMRYAFTLRGVSEYDESTGAITKGSKGKKKGVIDVTTVEDFNTEHQGLEQLLANLKIILKKHNTNIIVTAHLITTQYMDPGGKESRIRRDILTAGRKIAAFLPSQFDEIYHFYVDNESWKIKTYNDGIVPARSSFLRMPKEINWTQKNLFEQVSKYYFPSERKKEE